MKNFLCVLRASASGAILALGLQGASAQTPPPRHDTKSPLGVSYRSLSFTYEEEDLSIGGEGHVGLTLRRSYSNNPPSNPSTMIRAYGWSDNYASSITNEPAPHHPLSDPWQGNLQPWLYHVSTGTKTYTFEGGTTGGQASNPSHVIWGAYRSISKNGARLTYTGDTLSDHYELVESDGTLTVFTPGITNARVSYVLYPDGTKIDFTYNGLQLESVFSNRGWAILFDAPGVACVVNLSKTYATPFSSCPVDTRKVTYGYTPGNYRGAANVLKTITKGGATATYDYTQYDHLACLREPGQSNCSIQNTYAECPAVPGNYEYTDWKRHNDDYVVSQVSATGEVYEYVTDLPKCQPALGDPYLFPWQSNTASMTVNGSQTTIVSVGTGGMPYSVTDPMRRTFGYTYENELISYVPETVDLASSRDPEGNFTSYIRDDRGNITQVKKVAKPGSGLSDIVTSSVFPSTCVAAKTCNKPTSVTDAKGNTTSYTYDPAHGGVLTQTLPAVDGIQPVKRYSYAQHYAWLKASGSGYVQAPTPVWLLSEERTCLTSATVGNGCAAGAADEVVTSYEYQAGSATTPSNLLLKGVAVTSNGTTLRTCYGYDGYGRKISETKPRAGLAVCP